MVVEKRLPLNLGLCEKVWELLLYTLTKSVHMLGAYRAAQSDFLHLHQSLANSWPLLYDRPMCTKSCWRVFLHEILCLLLFSLISVSQSCAWLKISFLLIQQTCPSQNIHLLPYDLHSPLGCTFSGYVFPMNFQNLSLPFLMSAIESL